MSLVQALIVVGLGVESVFAQANFSGTVTLGSILLGIIVLVVAALFTIRSNVASVWRQEAEGQKAAVARERQERDEAVAEMQHQLDEEREVRHELKNELAAANALLLVERNKPDLSIVAETQKQTLAVLTQLAAASQQSATSETKLDEIHGLDEALDEIASLKKRLGIEPDEPT
jgi:biopolymer transport protein ExbB/TolQ